MLPGGVPRVDTARDIINVEEMSAGKTRPVRTVNRRANSLHFHTLGDLAS